MDFLDPKKRKAHRIKLFIGYALMAAALLFASVILLYQSYGYDYDTKTGRIVQNGFVFLSAHPDGADIYLNGKSKGRTDQRLDVAAGDYTIELKNDGYRTWKRQFTLMGGTIERFIYPFLFPTDLKTSDAQVYGSAPALITQSPDRKLVLVQQPGGFQNFDLVDVSAKSATSTTISLPPTLMETTGPTHALELVEWSTDNQHVVLKHTYAGGQEFVVLDIKSPAASINLSRTFKGTAFSTLALKDKKYDQYYLFDEAGKTLFSASLKSATPTLYQANVLAFRSHGDQELAFVTDSGANAGKVLVKVREGSDVYTVREMPAGSKYLLDLTSFDGDWYIASGVAENDRVFILKNPVAVVKGKSERQPQPIAVLRTPAATEFISFSTNARFIATQSGRNFAVYDAETARQYRYDSGLNLPNGQKVAWMDGHRLTTVVGDHAVVFDYDGTNQQTLTNAINGSAPLFDPDYTAMFTLSPSVKDAAKSALVRTELRVTK